MNGILARAFRAQLEFRAVTRKRWTMKKEQSEEVSALYVTDAERRYIAGLIGMDARKDERGLAKKQPYPGQTPEGFARFTANIRAQIERSHALRRKVLGRLSEPGHAPE